MDNPLVSVNLTTYNRAHLLPRALDSILVQTYPSLEIVVVDDCSPDNTAEIVRRYQEQDRRIKYFRHKVNKGNAFARNTALRHCTGHYVAFMDDDDEWIYPEKLAKQVALLDQHPDIVIVCSNVRIFKSPVQHEVKIIKKPKNLKADILIGNGIIYNSTVMTRKAVMTEIGGFDENMPKGIDSEYFRTCIVKYGYDVHFMPEITTAVHEYGDGRMTPLVDNTGVWKAIHTHLYLVKKYFVNYVMCPAAFIKRIRSIITLLVKLRFNKQMILIEGIFRRPRLRSNETLKKYSPLFSGDVVNVSASNDSDKNCSIFDYYFGDYDTGARYKSYFCNAKSYTMTNYPSDETKMFIDENCIALDLEKKLEPFLIEKFDVVFNHTTLEHVFDIFKAFKNLCTMSKDIVILVVPQFQKIHDYHRGYKDYWRFTPFAIERLFSQNGMTVVYRETTHGFSESQYLFYIASKKPEQWKVKFDKVHSVEQYINTQIDGTNYTQWSKLIIFMDQIIRFLIRKILYVKKKGKSL